MRAGKVDADPPHIGKTARRFADAAPDADDVVSVRVEPGDDVRADETVGAGDENAHQPRLSHAETIKTGFSAGKRQPLSGLPVLDKPSSPHLPLRGA
jgi:hypothetical protein